MSDLALLVLPALFGCGVVLIVVGVVHGSPPRGAARTARVEEWLTQSGVRGMSVRHLLAICGGAGLVAGLVIVALSGSVWLGLAFGGLAGYAPVMALRARRRRRQLTLADVWPDAIDNLASAVRAGLSLGEAVAALAERGPEPLRPAFALFASRYRASGRFSPALDVMKDELADPTADRVVETLRIAREVGGAELGRTLRTLSGFLRDEQRVRKELLARQSWTVVAARLAYATPWFVLFLLSLRPDAAIAYRGAGGAVVIGIGAGLATVGYRLMLVVGRIPAERRVLG